MSARTRIREAESVTAAMQALADPTRLRILLMLGGGEAHVTDLWERLGCTQPTTSHHLGVLRTVGMVQARRHGKRIYYRLTEPAPAPGNIRVSAGSGSIRVRPR